MSVSGYYRDPTVQDDVVVLVCEQDLWQVTLSDPVARRLTAGVGVSRFPCFSPDGRWLAFTGTQEGQEEVYVMPASGGVPQRLTFLGGTSCQVLGWADPETILFASNAHTPFRQGHIYQVSKDGGTPQRMPFGPATFYHRSTDGQGAVMQRHGYGYASWKRYRGGTAGELWIDRDGEGSFKKLVHLEGNLLRPFWVKDRIYFLSDHEGHGNVYSCTPQGEGMTRHTHHEDFYVRGLQTDGKRLVYHAGGKLWMYDLAGQEETELAVSLHSSKPMTQRSFVCPQSNLSSFDLNPDGNSVSITTRGRLFRASPHKGPVFQQGERDGVRYRLATWLHQGNRMISVRDDGLEEVLEIYGETESKPLQVIQGLDWGRILEIKASPKADALLLTNHRHELCHVDLESQTLRVIDRSAYGEVQGFAWSPDGKWVAYGVHLSHKVSIIRLHHLGAQKTTDVTQPVEMDKDPSFDPEGKYLYFLSNRTFQPNWDALTFDLHFSKATKPYVVTLQKDTLSPFVPPLTEADAEGNDKDKPGASEGEKTDPDLIIDVEGLSTRIQEFPLSEGRYRQIEGLPKGKVLLLAFPVNGEGVEDEDEDDEEAEKGTGGNLSLYEFQTLKHEVLIRDVQHVCLSHTKQHLIYLSGSKRLRILKAGEKPEDHDTSYKAGGWLDWDRVRLSTTPPKEWAHMFDEAWRLQKELFWTKTLSNVDWDEVYRRYRPLVEAVATREELLDLIADMQGELGSSHAYVWATQSDAGPSYTLGQLGATFAFDPKHGAYRVERFFQGDGWSASQGCPLQKPGLNLKKGDLIWAVCGHRLSETYPPEKALVHQVGQIIPLWVSDGKGDNKRMVYVTPLASTSALCYRDWVEGNRRYVHAQTQGRIGYLHVPDMSSGGFAEFHRGYLAEHHREGLIVDVRFNRGGIISGLLLEKLARKRLGFDETRWIDKVFYPLESPAGPMAALCNEYTASDGDMFSHSFKKMGLGPLIGKRTWGGVIGIFPRHPLLDGSMTTQPEYAFWFHDVGWSIENRGVNPDIVVDMTPTDYESGKDPQLDRGIQEVMQQLEQADQSLKETGEKPDLSPKPLSR